MFLTQFFIKSMRDLSIKKLYYSISEVSKITDIEQYVLRYWETEFEQLSPQKNRAGNRIYTNKDIRLILYIKELLRAFDTDNGQVEAAIERGFTLASVGILIAALLFILLAINMIRTYVKYFDFQISKHKHSLLISSGLLTKKNTLLNLNFYLTIKSL